MKGEGWESWESQPLFCSLGSPQHQGPGLFVHVEAELDFKEGGAAEILQWGLSRDRKSQGHLPSREFPDSQWIYKWVKWTCAKKRLHPPSPFTR